jgi:hypothetical protein
VDRRRYPQARYFLGHEEAAVAGRGFPPRSLGEKVDGQGPGPPAGSLPAAAPLTARIRRARSA